MPRRGLAFQLGTAFAVVAAATALLAGLIVFVAWQSSFDTYVRERVQADASVLADSAARAYEPALGWSADGLVDVAVIGARSGLRVQVLNVDGKVLIDSADLPAGIGMPGMMPGIGVTGEPGTAGRMRDPVVRVPVYVDAKVVGTVRVSSVSPGSFLTDRDVAFRYASFEGLAIAAVLAVLLASAGGVLFSRGFTRPIERVTATAADLRAGRLDARTGMRGADAVGSLGRTLDEMADSIQAERELERRLTADVAHELRTPLQAIQATVEAMQDGVMPADGEHLNVVRDETVRLGRLADSILELTRLETRSASFHMAEIDVADPLSQAVDSHRALLESMELTLAEDIAAGARVEGDADRLTQAFGNLLANAARYTPAGGTVTVTLRAEAGEAVVEVGDTGIGIPEEERERVFSRFWRSEAARERSKSGFGIGLAVVREIAERHGGSVAFRPNEGPGTTFTVRLPLAERKGRLAARAKA